MTDVKILDGDFSVARMLDQKGYELVTSNRHRLVFDVAETDYQLEIRGDFKLTSSGDPKSGTINTLTFTVSLQGAVVRADVGDTDVGFGKFYKYLLNEKSDENLALLMGGNDKIAGSTESDDSLDGYAGNDVINGGAGHDYIYAGAGNDRFTGGDGNDTFRFEPGSGRDIITDFEARAGHDDRDYFSGDPDDVKAILKSGDDTIVKFYGGDRVTLLGVDHDDFSLDDYWSP